MSKAPKSTKAERKVAELPPKSKKEEKKSSGHRGGRRRSSYESFDVYIRRVLKQVHPSTKINSNALVMVDFMIDELIRLVGITVTDLLLLHRRKTVTAREIEAVVQLVLPGELAKHATAEGAKALQKYRSGVTKSSAEKGARNGHSKSFRSGIVFPVTRTQKRLARHVGGKARNGSGAGVYLAAVIEYLVAEVLELAGNLARDLKKTRISDRNILLAIKKDNELSHLTRHWVLQGGVLPGIHSALLPKSSKSKS
jgi:histone H2A